jgi:hypothetical protein
MKFGSQYTMMSKATTAISPSSILRLFFMKYFDITQFLTLSAWFHNLKRWLQQFTNLVSAQDTTSAHRGLFKPPMAIICGQYKTR